MNRYIVILILLITPSLAHTGNTGLPWSSNYETNDISEWEDRLGDIDIVDEKPRSGNFCLQVKLSEGNTNDHYASTYFGDHVLVSGDKVTTIYLKLAAKFSSEYTLWPESQQQIAMLAITDGISEDEQFKVIIAVDSNSRYVVALGGLNKENPQTLLQNVGTEPVDVRNGQWDDLKLRVKLNRPGQSDGIIEFWVNKVLKLQYNDLNIRRNTDYGINRLSLTSMSLPVGRAAGFLYVDNWRLYTLSAPTGLKLVITPK